jgi:hypothetical protein
LFQPLLHQQKDDREQNLTGGAVLSQQLLCHQKTFFAVGAEPQ